MINLAIKQNLQATSLIILIMTKIKSNLKEYNSRMNLNIRVAQSKKETKKKTKKKTKKETQKEPKQRSSINSIHNNY